MSLFNTHALAKLVIARLAVDDLTIDAPMETITACLRRPMIDQCIAEAERIKNAPKRTKDRSFGCNDGIQGLPYFDQGWVYTGFFTTDPTGQWWGIRHRSTRETTETREYPVWIPVPDGVYHFELYIKDELGRTVYAVTQIPDYHWSAMAIAADDHVPMLRKIDKNITCFGCGALDLTLPEPVPAHLCGGDPKGDAGPRHLIYRLDQDTTLPCGHDGFHHAVIQDDEGQSHLFQRKD